MSYLETPVEAKSIDGWKGIPIKECGEPLVPLGSFSRYPQIHTRSVYFGEGAESPYFNNGFGGSLITMFVRQGTADRLVYAQSLLPENTFFVVFDAHRTVSVQQALFDRFISQLKEIHPDWGEKDLLLKTQKYVSIPSLDSRRPSPHNADAVDLALYTLPDDISEEVEMARVVLNQYNLTPKNRYQLEITRAGLINQNARSLNFGVPFDWGGKESAADYYERLAETKPLTDYEIEARNNRRLLINVMRQAGLIVLDSEYWHFNSKKSQMGAQALGLEYAEYGSSILSSENLMHEAMRKLYWTLGRRLPKTNEKRAIEAADFTDSTFAKATIILPN